MYEGNVSTIPLVPAVQQQSHKELLTPIQVEEAKKMGVKGITVKNTQFDLLKLVKFQFDRKRTTSKLVLNLCKKHGRKKTKQLMKKRYEMSLSK